MKKLSLVLEIVISLIFLAVLLHFAGASDVVKIIANVKLEWLLLSLLILLFVHVGMTYRIVLILNRLNSPISFITALKCHLAGMLASDFTPARSGYFTTAFALSRNHSVPAGKGMVSILGPQLFDFGLKAIAGGAALAYILYFRVPDGPSSPLAFTGIAVVSLMIVAGILLLFSKRFANFLGFISRLPFGDRVHSLIVRMQENSHAVKALFPQITLLLIFTWICKGLSWYALAVSIGVTADFFNPFLFYLFLQPLVSMLEFMPTPTLAGMGLSEAGVAVVLSMFGVPLAVGVGYGILVRFSAMSLNAFGIAEIVRTLKIKS